MSTSYGRPLSVSGRPCYVLPMFIYLFFLWPPYSPALVNGGSRKFYTWWILRVITEVSTWDFFLVTLRLQGGPKSDEIWRIFRPYPQTFYSHTRMRQNIVILKKNLLSTDGCSTRNATLVNFGLQTPEIHASQNSLKMTRVNSLRHALFPFARCQQDHAQAPYDTVIVCPMLCSDPLTH